MSVIGGPNNPISNGLVYALDFKNNRSYVSGSTSARSLTFTTATATVTGSNIYQIPNLVNGLLQFNLGSSATTGSWIQIPTIFDSVNSLGQFTILVTAEGKNNNNFLSDTSDTANTRWGAGLGSQIGLGFGQGQSTQYGRGFTNPATSLSHIVYRYSSGSFTIFVNGIPISSSNTSFSQNRSQGGSSFLISGRHPQQDALWSGSLGNVFIYNRALTNDEIRANYTLASREYGLPTPPSFSIDENAYLFSQTAGITSSAYITALDTFVRGLKSASLWDKMVGIYPFLGGNNTLNQLNLKESSLTVYPASFTGSWSSSFSGSRSNTTASYATLTGLTPSTYHPLVNTQSFHMAYLSYDTPTTGGFLMGTGTGVGATGGTISYANGRVYHTFTSGSGSFIPTHPSLTSVEVFTIGGGGGGGGPYGGGGGAGGAVYSASFAVTPSTVYTASIGLGGSGNNFGQNTQFSTIVAYGGGRGTPGSSTAGGGAGANFNPATSRSAAPGQGFDGALGDGSSYGGGGGGIGSAGAIGFSSGGANGGYGGSGSFFSQFSHIGGSPAGWFGGGGGGFGNNKPGLGGIGGGGKAGENFPGFTGSANTGGGGGSGNDGGLGAQGGSGIVIVSYPVIETAGTSSSTIYLTPTSLSGSANNDVRGAFTTGGPIGMITVSRTGSNSYTIAKNKVPVNITARASASLNSNLFLNSININNSSYSSSQNNVAYASVGAGLTNSEINTYYNIVNTFQKSVGRSDLDYISVLGYAAALGYALPTSDQQVKQERLMSDLKQAGIWNKLDTFGVFATNGDSNFALVDWKRLTSYTAVNSPSFISNQGFTGNSLASSSISLNYQSVTNWVNASLNNACEFVWNFGQSGLVTGDSSINKYINTGTGSVNQRFHSSTTLPFTFAANETVGLHSRVRNNSADYQLYFNGNLKGTTTTTSAMPTSDFSLFKVGVPGYFESWHDTSAKIYGYGAALTSTEISNLYTILNTYLNSL
jgi:hypothetical protein